MVAKRNEGEPDRNDHPTAKVRIVSNDERSTFYEFKTFIDHLSACGECRTKLYRDDLFGEVMAHAHFEMTENSNLIE